MKDPYFLDTNGNVVSPLLWYRLCPACSEETDHIVISAKTPYLVCSMCKTTSKVDITPIP